MDEGERVDDRLRDEIALLTSTMCKAVSDPKRLLLLYALRGGPRSVGDLTEWLDAPQANVSQHLAVLREFGLVDSDRRGSHVIYSLRHRRLLDAIEIMREVQSSEAARRTDLLT